MERGGCLPEAHAITCKAMCFQYLYVLAGCVYLGLAIRDKQVGASPASLGGRQRGASLQITETPAIIGYSFSEADLSVY